MCSAADSAEKWRIPECFIDSNIWACSALSGEIAGSKNMTVGIFRWIVSIYVVPIDVHKTICACSLCCFIGVCPVLTLRFGNLLFQNGFWLLSKYSCSWYRRTQVLSRTTGDNCSVTIKQLSKYWTRGPLIPRFGDGYLYVESTTNSSVERREDGVVRRSPLFALISANDGTTEELVDDVQPQER